MQFCEGSPEVTQVSWSYPMDEAFIAEFGLYVAALLWPRGSLYQ
jgi:hypothetical protein